MAIENEPFEDAFPIENSDFPASYVSFPEGNPPIFPTMFKKPLESFPNIEPRKWGSRLSPPWSSGSGESMCFQVY